MNDVKTRVLAVVEEVLGLTSEEIDLNASIREELAPESLDQVTLFMTLSDEFNDTISQEDAEPLKTLTHIIEYITSRGH